MPPALSPASEGLAVEAQSPAARAAEGRRPKEVRARRRLPLSVISALSVLLVLAAWEGSSRSGLIDALLLPAPSEIARSTWELIDTGYRQVPLWQHIGVSVLRALSAFLAAVLIGIPSGLAMGLSPTVNAVLNPFVQFLRPLPKIALIPLAIVWFGIGEGSKFFLIFLSTVLSVMVSAASATANVGTGRIRAAQVLGASRRQIYTHVVLPHVLPELFTGVRLAVGIGWTTLIAAEMVAATAGLGWMVVNAGNYMRTDVVMLGIVLLGMIGWLFDVLLVWAQRRIVPWSGKDS